MTKINNSHMENYLGFIMDSVVPHIYLFEISFESLIRHVVLYRHKEAGCLFN